jgi:hypothetical protein
LLDAAFPAGSDERGHSGVVLVRWDKGEETDVGLIQYAKTHDFDGVVFLGHDAVARTDVIEAASQLALTVVVVNTDFPNRAVRYLENNLSDLKQRGRGGQVLLVLANEVRPINLAATLASP